MSLQANYLITGIRPCPWDEETVLSALEHRIRLSRSQYDWLRQRGYPLPGLTTLQTWLSSFVVRPGSCDLQMHLLEKILATLPQRDRSCVVMYDEMDIMGVATYDTQLDQRLGPHKKLQQFMAGGIFNGWKLPVMFEFDRRVTKPMLLGLILAMERVGARVVAVVGDMGGTNQGLWTELGVSFDGDTFFVNPMDPSR